MSLNTQIRVWKHSQTRGAMRCLMLAIADLANDDGIAWPGTAKLAEKINETPDYTGKLIKRCVDLAELAEHTGRGRGHTTRFAVLCGLDPDAQKRLKGVLQKGFCSTPLEKRGTTKGVLSSGKRGKLLPSENGLFEPLERAETPLDNSDILHDPTVGGGGDRARAKKTAEPEHVCKLLQAGMGAAREFRDLDGPACLADFQARVAAGIPIGVIVDTWRQSPPEPGNIYDRPAQPDVQPAQPRGTARGVGNRAGAGAAPHGRHGPTGGLAARDPTYYERMLARLERGEPQD